MLSHISTRVHKGEEGTWPLDCDGLASLCACWTQRTYSTSVGIYNKQPSRMKLSLFESLSWGQSLRGIIAVRVTEVTGNDFHIYIGNWASLVWPNTNACKDSGWCVPCLGRHISYNGQGGPYDRVQVIVDNNPCCMRVMPDLYHRMNLSVNT